MRKLVLAITVSALPFAARAETLPIVFGGVGDEQLGLAREIGSAMAANPRCAGVSLSANTHTAVDHWALVLPYYEPRDGKHGWAMQKVVGGRLNSIVIRGNGNPADIAEVVCGIVKAQGATVLLGYGQAK
jgi:hypothetical protein